MTRWRKKPILAILSACLSAGCASRKPPPAETWVDLGSEKRQDRLQAAPSFDPRLLRYNNGQIEFVERPAPGAVGPTRDTSRIPIVYVHGLGGNMGDFAPLLLAPDPQADSGSPGRSPRPAIAVNMPGTGLSTNLRNEYTIGDQAQALHELLIHRMQFRKVDLVCHSLGGQVCMAFGLENPGNVSSVTLIDAAGSYDQGEFAQRMAKQYGKVNLGNVSVVNHPAITIFTGGNQSLVNRLVSEDPAVISALDSFNQNYRNHIRNLSVPVLLIWGENDPIFPVQNGFFLLSNIRNIRMKVVPGAGHVPQLSHPELVRTWIRQFHASLTAARD